MVLKCLKWQFYQRNHLVLLHFICIFFGLFSFIVTADDQSLNNNHANQTAEIKAKLLKIIQKGKFINKFIRIKKKYLHECN